MRPDDEFAFSCFLFCRTARVTAIDAEKEAAELKRQEEERQRIEEEKRKRTLEMVKEDIKADLAALQAGDDDVDIEEDVNDPETTEAEYEAWKIRELKRLKREREERNLFVHVV
jgi:microfibrillar-associated protein 1